MTSLGILFLSLLITIIIYSIIPTIHRIVKGPIAYNSKEAKMLALLNVLGWGIIFIVLEVIIFNDVDLKSRVPIAIIYYFVSKLILSCGSKTKKQ